MHSSKATSLVLALTMTAVACPEAPPEVPSIQDDFEDVLFDFLACDERASPSTLARLRAVIDEPSTENAIALVTAPEALASVVAMAGPQVELTVIALQNIRLAATGGHGAQLIEDGWDGLSCDDVLPLACTAGTATSTVVCDDGDSVSGVVISYGTCVLGGTRFDGDLVYARQADDSARLGGEDFSVDEVRGIDGELAVAVAGGGTDIRARDVDGVGFVSFGGPDGGLSCGERLQADDAVVEVVGSSVYLELQGRHITVDSSTALETSGSHITVTDVVACPCPDAGSSLQLRLDDVAGTEQAGVIDVSWRGAGADDGCRRVSVSASSWPSSCSGFGDDCGQEAIEKTLSGLLGAFCFPADG